MRLKKFEQLLLIMGIVISISFLFSCTKPSGKNIKGYYFPIDELQGDGKVYEYESTGEINLPTFYWHYKTIKENGTIFLLCDYYDNNFNIFQTFKEEIVSNGVLITDYKIIERDTSGNEYPAQATINSGATFPFFVTDSTEAFVFNVFWKNPRDTTKTITLIKNRRYLRDGEYEYDGKKYESVEFFVKNLVDDFQEGHIEEGFTEKEIYAKGLGLVYFEKTIEDFTMKYKLSTVYDWKDFKEGMEIIKGEQ